LADVLDLILDKGLVIDAYVRVSLVGIEILTVDARIVVASVDTYLILLKPLIASTCGRQKPKGYRGLCTASGTAPDRSCPREASTTAATDPAIAKAPGPDEASSKGSSARTVKRVS
jgi:hypothetical protein